MLDRFHGISKFYIAKGKTDLRMGIDGLVHKITAEFKLDPYDNTAFLFCGGRSNRLKVVIWEGDGFTLMYKRFEKGRMQWLPQVRLHSHNIQFCRHEVVRSLSVKCVRILRPLLRKALREVRRQTCRHIPRGAIRLHRELPPKD